MVYETCTRIKTSRHFSRAPPGCILVHCYLLLWGGIEVITWESDIMMDAEVEPICPVRSCIEQIHGLQYNQKGTSGQYNDKRYQAV